MRQPADVSKAMRCETSSWPDGHENYLYQLTGKWYMVVGLGFLGTLNPDAGHPQWWAVPQMPRNRSGFFGPFKLRREAEQYLEHPLK